MTPARVLALVGPRCAGKSTLAAALATHFGVPAFDLDDLLLESAEPPSSSAGALLAEIGEEAFRDHESTALARFLEDTEPSILATGGGVVCRAENRRRLVDACLVVRLDAPSEVLAARLRADSTPRPSLTGADPADELDRLARERAAWYSEVADLTLDAAAEPSALVRDLARLVRQRRDGSFVREGG